MLRTTMSPTPRILRLALLLPGLVIHGCRGGAADDHAAAREAVRAFTQARTRVVWLQDQKEGTDVFATGTDLLIMTFDTDEPGGPRPLVARPDNYRKPLITPDGGQVVFTNRRENRVHVAAWDGSWIRVLCPGVAIQVWRDPRDGVDWVYVADENLENPREPHRDLRRIRLDGQGPVEPVWNRTEISMNHLQISRDGTRAAGLFPWPEGGLLDLRSKTWQRYGRGCCVSMAPDDSYVFWIFDGTHRNLQMRSPADGMRWSVPVNDAPGVEGYQVFHPRWTNHARYMVMTGPYRVGAGPHRIRGGGEGVEIYLGRFSDNLGSIESWCRVTHNDKADFFPDVWIETGPDSDILEELAARREMVLHDLDATASPVATGESWPGSVEDLVFVWKNAASHNEIRQGGSDRIVDCRVESEGRARYGRMHEMRPAGGSFRAPDSEERLLDACRRSNEITVEAVVTPDDLGQHGPARIVSFSRDILSRNFTLGQEGDTLVFRVRTAQTSPNADRPLVQFGALRPDVAHHVVVSYRPGMLACYVDGQPAFISEEIQGGFETWEEQTFLFGNEATGDRPWRGGLEGVAILSRFVGPAEARDRYDLYAAELAGRKAAPRFAMRGKLLAKSATPSPESITPYRRALAVYTYEIAGSPRAMPTPAALETLAHPVPRAGERILAAHWVVMDAEVVPFQRQVGNEYELLLEPFEQHPQLEGERLLIDTDAFDLEMFIDVEE